jgi:B-cell receptor-associated protein 31
VPRGRAHTERHHSAQRNTYLTGFCLFLSVVLTRTFYIIQDLIHTQDEYAKLKKAVSDLCFRL